MNPHAEGDARAYLLGNLADQQADEFENLYFADQAFFTQVRAVERKLIADYLDGRLPAEDRQRFEARYLRIPELRRTVARVRRQRAQRWGIPALVAAALAVGLWLGPGLRTTQTPVALVLAPGISKASGGAATLALPSRAPVQLALEVMADEPSFTVRIFAISGAGERKLVATQSRLRVNQSHQLLVALEPGLLTPGDYIAEVLVGEEVRDSYIFKAVSP